MTALDDYLARERATLDQLERDDSLPKMYALLDAVELLAEMQVSEVGRLYGWGIKIDAVLSRLTADSEGAGT